MDPNSGLIMKQGELSLKLGETGKRLPVRGTLSVAAFLVGEMSGCIPDGQIFKNNAF